MKLTAKGRYAVMAMADLANFNKQQKPVSLNDISIRQGISLSFLEQLFLKLKKKDLVTSVRGNLGGYRLSKEPSKIHLSSITNPCSCASVARSLVLSGSTTKTVYAPDPPDFLE